MDFPLSLVVSSSRCKKIWSLLRSLIKPAHKVSEGTALGPVYRSIGILAGFQSFRGFKTGPQFKAFAGLKQHRNAHLLLKAGQRKSQ